MGICIHFDGKLDSEEQYIELIKFSISYATEHDWTVIHVEADGKVGVKLIVHELCDPIFLEFGPDWTCNDFVKTQFAGVDCHIGVTEFFRKIKDFFMEFDVFDEGEYWDTGDRRVLEEQFGTITGMIVDMLKREPHLKSPGKTSDGRFLDAVD